MKNWPQAKEAYIKDHLSKALEYPERRLDALKAIEKTFQEKFPELINDRNLFENIKKVYFLKLYECLKGSPLSGAENSVITGLYKFSD
jgi:hypothetical protein